MTESNPYLDKLNAQGYAYGLPEVTGRIKEKPSDFQVVEVMDVEPSGEGEHFWLDISKIGLSSERVAKCLARHSGVAYRDVGYAGMKDVNAQTRQWFSVWMPKQLDFDWVEFAQDGVTVHSIKKHSRKLKRGTHKANRFVIRVTNLAGKIDGLESKLKTISSRGVPNYFGEQRFGYSANNLTKAEGLFIERRKIKDRQLKSIVLSSARSYLFNAVLSERIKSNSWDSLFMNEPASLDGSNAVFQTNGEPENDARLSSLDIHPTAPMWGRGFEKANEQCFDLAEFEMAIVGEYEHFTQGLEKHGLEYQRRATRSVPKELQYELKGDELELSFTLQKGQFATSILRELIRQA
jgi:tRNA pseudouridine13 synthase